LDSTAKLREKSYSVVGFFFTMSLSAVLLYKVNKKTALFEGDVLYSGNPPEHIVCTASVKLK
jgi:hypothetical protein